MENIQIIRRTAAAMANQLHKLGYSLSNACGKGKMTGWRWRLKLMMCFKGKEAADERLYSGKPGI
ncbi:hypothetical protein D7V86_23735 [bacterium D16-51]|nr:hypothetical protein D7V96_22070 [bacterium D16-59]RKI54299.1 hypothetical protein D7V86_23735 [bacterium D16-51]